MNPEELKELKELIEFLKETGVNQFELERGELSIRLQFTPDAPPPAPAPDYSHLAHLLSSAQHAAPAPAPVSAAPAAPSAPSAAAAPTAPADENAGLHTVKSPIVGTFYESPSPGAPAFVKPGDIVESGQVLCIIEAMKLMNEIESDISGEIVKRFVTTGQPVEYGQPLFAVRPS